MTAALRLALLGYGFAGKTFHAPLIRNTPGLELDAVASSRPAAVLAELPASRPFADFAQVLADPAIDAVVIATPNDTHAAIAEAALLAGKHVVVDKPLTLTLAHARRLGKLAEECGRVLSVFHNRRWDSDFLALQEVLGAGLIGRPTHVESRFDRFRPTVRERWREKAESGGGVWFDLGPHLVDQALQLFGLPLRLGGSIAHLRDAAQADDWFQILLDYGRLQVTLSSSMLVAGGIPRLAAHGTRGSWIKHGLDAQEDQLRAGMLPGEAGWGVDPQAAVLFSQETGVAGQPWAVPAGDYLRYYAGVRDAMLGRGANPVTPAQAIATMAVLETGVEAARCGRWLELPLVDSERQAFGRARFADLVAP